MVELFESPVEFLLFGNDPRGENLIDNRVESPQLVDGHLLKLRSVITNVQSPAPGWGGSQQSQSSKPGLLRRVR